MAAGFIFGGNTGETAQSLARKRAYAEALLAPGETPRNATEGWGAIAKALAGRFALSGVEKEEGERRQRASDAVARALGGVGPFPDAPNAGSAGGSAVMAALNGEQPAKPVNPNLPSRLDFANAANAQQPGEIESYIRQAAIERGIDPDIAVRVARSEGGLVDPVRQSDVIKDGVREPSFGPFQLYMNGGLGNAFQAETGLHPSDPNAWRQGVDFALDSAKKDGWGAWYGAKNVGITGMDGIGAPGAALGRLAAGTPQGPGRQGEIRQGSDGRSYQYAETTGMANATGPQGWIPVNAQAPVQVAQAGGDFSQFSPAAGGTGGTVQPGELDLGLLFEAARNPDLSAEERGLINMLVGQEMEKRDPLRRLQMQKLEKELGTPQKQWQKLDDETLFDPASGEVKKVGGAPAGGGGFRFKGTSVEAQALNGLMDSNALTVDQAQQLAAGKTISGPNGEILFLTPQGVFGQPAAGGPATPVTPAAPASSAPAEEDPQRSGVLPVTGPKTTVDERKAAGFADRMAESEKLIGNFGNAGLSAKDQFIRGNDYIPDVLENFMVGDDFQKFDQARRDFINAQLRRESGAVISDEEFDNANKQYFPQPGDTKETIEQKRRNRATVINAMKRDAGPTYGGGGSAAPADGNNDLKKKYGLN